MLELREAREQDCRLLWVWANDPSVRAASFRSEPIPWEQHTEWFNSRINSAACVIYIATELEGTPVGQIRFDLEGSIATISIIIDATFRGRGYGTEAIRLASERLFKDYEVNSIHAYVKPDNRGSVRGFTAAHYQRLGTKVVRGQEAVHFELSGPAGK